MRTDYSVKAAYSVRRSAESYPKDEEISELV